MSGNNLNYNEIYGFVLDIPINAFKINELTSFLMKCDELYRDWDDYEIPIQEVTKKVELGISPKILNDSNYFEKKVLVFYPWEFYLPKYKGNIRNLLKEIINDCGLFIELAPESYTCHKLKTPLSVCLPEYYTFRVEEAIDYLLQPEITSRLREYNVMSLQSYYELYYSKEYRSWKEGITSSK